MWWCSCDRLDKNTVVVFKHVSRISPKIRENGSCAHINNSTQDETSLKLHKPAKPILIITSGWINQNSPMCQCKCGKSVLGGKGVKYLRLKEIKHFFLPQHCDLRFIVGVFCLSIWRNSKKFYIEPYNRAFYIDSVSSKAL